MRARARLSVIAVLAACGAKPPPAPWVEEELGSQHATAEAAPEEPTPAPPPRYATAAEADAALAAAVRARRDREAVIAASALAARGGELAPHRAAVTAAIDRLPAAELEAVWRALDPAREPAGAVALRAALAAAHVGQRERAVAWIARARRAADGPALAARLDAIERDLPKPADPARVAVLLPLSGRFAALGAELRAAIELAAAEPAPEAEARAAKPTLVWLDTAGDDTRVAGLVERAVAAGAVAILGPVGDREAIPAARRAAELGVPIALLAPGDGADPAAGVFRVVTSPADEARAAARVAADLDARTAGVLAPADDVGAAMADAFAGEAKAAGVTVTARGSYDPNARDLEPDVKAFLGLVPAKNPRLAAHLRRFGKQGWQTFSPDVPFAVLYVPDQHERAALVASFLPYLGVEVRTREIMDPLLLRRKHRGRIPQVVQLLGSSGWNHPGLITRGGAAVEGALIVDVFAGELDSGAGADFAARFRDARGRPPSSAAAQAYDAARLVLDARARAAAAAAPEPRAALRAALTNASLDDGACGPARIGADGEVARAPVLLTVDGGEILPGPP